MILWTIQPKLVLEALERHGQYRADGRYSVLLGTKGKNYFRQSYRWMINQMILHGIQKDHHYPIWAWYRYNLGRTWAPTLAQSRVMCNDDPEYRIKFDAPKELVLLSGFESWHGVLNRFYVGSAVNAEHWWENQDEKTMIESWPNIFRVNPHTCTSPYSKGKPVQIQGCLPILKQEWMLEVKWLK